MTSRRNRPARSTWTRPPGWDEYTTSQRRNSATWKSTTPDLPDAARAPAPFAAADGTALTGPLAFCLPADHATHNLLPTGLWCRQWAAAASLTLQNHSLLQTALRRLG